MKRLIGTLSTVCALSTLSGCAVNTQEETAPEAAGGSKTLAVLPTATGELAFLDETEAGGLPQVGVLETGTIAGGASPLREALRDRALTSLEIFLAVSDREPPARLVEAHPFEAEDLGRPDATVVEVSIDMNAPVEKYSSEECTQIIFAAQTGWAFVNLQKWNNVANSSATFTYPYVSQALMRWGFCNDNSTQQNIKYEYRFYGESEWRTQTPSDPRFRTLGPNQWMAYQFRWRNASTPYTEYRAKVSRAASTGTNDYDVRVMELWEPRDEIIR
jgi:hypothetical protein